jgi:hypothetical protein
MNLTPLIPLSLQRRGGRILIREAKPLFNTPLLPPALMERGKEILERGFTPLKHSFLQWGKSEGAEAPSETLIPPSLYE